MKLFVFLILFYSASTFANHCNNRITLVEAQKAVAGLPNAGAPGCALTMVSNPAYGGDSSLAEFIPDPVDDGLGDCICFDGLNISDVGLSTLGGKSVLVVDAAKQQVRLDVQALLNTKRAKRINRICGQGVIDSISLANDSKNLTRSQKKTLITDNRATLDFLSVGSLQEAKDELLETPADGILITESDKVDIVAAIDECLTP